MKRTLSLILAFAMLFSMMVTGITTQAVSFSDVSGHWAVNSIDYMSSYNVINGYPNGTFKPQGNVTKAEFIKMMNYTFGLSDTTSIAYTDVKSGDWFYSDIAKADANGYLTTSGNFVNPNQPLSRQEAAAMLARYLNLSTTSSASSFTDKNAISSAYVAYVVAAATEGIFTGYPDGSFKPTGTITRAEALTVLHRIVGSFVTGTSSTVTTANATITKPNTGLTNASITGDLLITEGAKNGVVTITGTTVNGKVYVKGNVSLNIVNSTINELVVDSTSGAATITTTGTSVVRNTTLKTATTLNNGTSNVSYGFDVVKTASAAGSTNSLKGAFKTVNVTTPSTTVNMNAGSTVDKLDIQTTASNTKVTGTGVVDTLTVNASGCSVATAPTSWTIKTGLSATIAGTTRTGSGYGSQGTNTNSGMEYGYPKISNYNSYYNSGTVALKSVTSGRAYFKPISKYSSLPTADEIINYANYNSNYYVDLYSSVSYKTFDLESGYDLAMVFKASNGAYYTPIRVSLSAENTSSGEVTGYVTDIMTSGNTSYARVSYDATTAGNVYFKVIGINQTVTASSVRSGYSTYEYTNGSSDTVNVPLGSYTAYTGKIAVVLGNSNNVSYISLSSSSYPSYDEVTGYVTNLSSSYATVSYRPNVSTSTTVYFKVVPIGNYVTAASVRSSGYTSDYYNGSYNYNAYDTVNVPLNGYTTYTGKIAVVVGNSNNVSYISLSSSSYPSYDEVTGYVTSLSSSYATVSYRPNVSTSTTVYFKVVPIGNYVTAASVRSSGYTTDSYNGYNTYETVSVPLNGYTANTGKIAVVVGNSNNVSYISLSSSYPSYGEATGYVTGINSSYVNVTYRANVSTSTYVYFKVVPIGNYVTADSVRSYGYTSDYYYGSYNYNDYETVSVPLNGYTAYTGKIAVVVGNSNNVSYISLTNTSSNDEISGYVTNIALGSDGRRYATVAYTADTTTTQEAYFKVVDIDDYVDAPYVRSGIYAHESTNGSADTIIVPINYYTETTGKIAAVLGSSSEVSYIPLTIVSGPVTTTANATYAVVDGTKDAVELTSAITVKFDRNLGLSNESLRNYFTVSEGDNTYTSLKYTVNNAAAGGTLVTIAHDPLLGGGGKWVADKAHTLTVSIPGVTVTPSSYTFTTVEEIPETVLTAKIAGASLSSTELNECAAGPYTIVISADGSLVKYRVSTDNGSSWGEWSDGAASHSYSTTLVAGEDVIIVEAKNMIDTAGNYSDPALQFKLQAPLPKIVLATNGGTVLSSVSNAINNASYKVATEIPAGAQLKWEIEDATDDTDKIVVDGNSISIQKKSNKESLNIKFWAESTGGVKGEATTYTFNFSTEAIAAPTITSFTNPLDVEDTISASAVNGSVTKYWMEGAKNKLPGGEGGYTSETPFEKNSTTWEWKADKSALAPIEITKAMAGQKITLTAQSSVKDGKTSNLVQTSSEVSKVIIVNPNAPTLASDDNTKITVSKPADGMATGYAYSTKAEPTAADYKANAVIGFADAITVSIEETTTFSVVSYVVIDNEYYFSAPTTIVKAAEITAKIADTALSSTAVNKFDEGTYTVVISAIDGSRVMYRVDGGEWSAAKTSHSHTAVLEAGDDEIVIEAKSVINADGDYSDVVSFKLQANAAEDDDD